MHASTSAGPSKKKELRWLWPWQRKKRSAFLEQARIVLHADSPREAQHTIYRVNGTEFLHEIFVCDDRKNFRVSERVTEQGRTFTLDQIQHGVICSRKVFYSLRAIETYLNVELIYRDYTIPTPTRLARSGTWGLRTFRWGGDFFAVALLRPRRRREAAPV